MSEENKVPEKDPWWTSERERAFEMLHAGTDKTAVAKALGRDRGTIKAWSDHEKFRARLDEINSDRLDDRRQRRSIESMDMTDSIARSAKKLLAQVEANPRDRHAMTQALDAVGMYKGMVEQERDLSGENVQKHQHQIAGQVDHRHSVAAVNFKGFLTEQMKRLAIDVDAEVQHETGNQALVEVTQRALSESDILDLIAEEEAKSRAPR